MNAHETSPLERFHRFVGEQLHAGAGVSLSPEVAVVLWRERQETIEAVREGLSDIETGTTKPLDEFLRDFANRHRILVQCAATRN